MNVKPIEQAAKPLVQKAEVILDSTILPNKPAQKVLDYINEFRPVSEPINLKALDRNDNIEAIAKEAGIGRNLDVFG